MRRSLPPSLRQKCSSPSASPRSPCLNSRPTSACAPPPGAPSTRTTLMHDAIIIGGSYAGLAAATQLARARRRILVIDAGQRRNRFAEHSHGFLSRDGARAADIVAEAKTQLLAYPTVEWRDATVVAATGAADAFDVTDNSGATAHSRRQQQAQGIRDAQP